MGSATSTPWPPSSGGNGCWPASLQRRDAAGTGLDSAHLDGRHHHRRVGRPDNREAGAGGRGLTTSGIKVAVSRSVDQLLWTKLLGSGALNPLAALLRVRNAQLLDRPDARELLGAAVREIVSVAHARGVALPPYSEAVEKVETICRNNATNKMSMLQDVERGSPTEIDYMSGAVVREGEAVGVPTPIHWTLTKLVKALTYPAESTQPSPEPPAR